MSKTQLSLRKYSHLFHWFPNLGLMSLQMLLFTHIRLAHGFSNHRKRLQAVQARLHAISILGKQITCNKFWLGSLDLVSFELHLSLLLWAHCSYLAGNLNCSQIASISNVHCIHHSWAPQCWIRKRIFMIHTSHRFSGCFLFCFFL